jgi:hypothetical protein
MRVHGMTEAIRPRPKLANIFRVMFIVAMVVFVAVVMTGNHPPAVAQPSPYYGPATVQSLQMSSVYQQGKIDAIKDHSDATQTDLDAYKKSQDDKMARIWVDVKANTDAVSTIKGEILGAGAFLTLLQIGAMVWGRKKVV